MARAADRLALAGTPAFALMALFAGVQGGGSSPLLCSVMPVPSPLGGMVVMYGLMSAIHCGPWLRLLGRRRDPGLRESQEPTTGALPGKAGVGLLPPVLSEGSG